MEACDAETTQNTPEACEIKSLRLFSSSNIFKPLILFSAGFNAG